MVNPEYISKPIKIGNKTAPNRIVYQPTESNNGDSKGSVTDTTVKKYTDLAKGGPGIIFVESLDVTLKTQARTNRLTVLPENLPGLKRLVSEVRAINSETLVIFQLSHAGALSDPSLKLPMHVYAREGEPVKAMITAEVEEARDEFVLAAQVAHESGADGVDVKQAHGFLAGDFLHPANLRQDRYGGSFENRTRFFREIIEGIRLNISDSGFIIGTRISPYEGVPGGCGTAEPDGLVEDLTEMLGYVKQLDAMGLDFIGVSAGYASANLEILLPTKLYREGVFRHFYWTKVVKEHASVPVIGSAYSFLRDGDNGIYGASTEKKSLLYWAEKNLREGFTDMVGLGRQAIADPYTAEKLLHKNKNIDWCTTCGACGALLGNQKAVGCPVYNPDYRT